MTTNEKKQEVVSDIYEYYRDIKENQQNLNEELIKILDNVEDNEDILSLSQLKRNRDKIFNAYLKQPKKL